MLPRYPDLGVCDYCRMPLGEVRARQNIPDLELWAAEAIADMVSHQADAGFSPYVSDFLSFLGEQVAASTQGNRAAFCRAIGLAKDALNGWFNKSERPSITQFLSICYGTRTMPSDAFSKSSPVSCPSSGLRKLPSKL